MSLDGDVATVRATLDAIPGKKILVGHSYGGAVISNAAYERSDLRVMVAPPGVKAEPTSAGSLARRAGPSSHRRSAPRHQSDERREVMDFRLAGKVAVVTGASKGIGLAVTRALVGEGVSVVAAARSLTADLAQLTAQGRVHPVEVDLGTPDGPARLIDETVGGTAGWTFWSTTWARSDHDPTGSSPSPTTTGCGG
jgi:pimeloyl-ACP methyl ester carboxylesterase